MRSSVDHILTSHAGSLPRPDDLIEAWGGNDEHALATKLTASVADVVRRQREVGIDVPGDGEFGKSMTQRVNYGSWWLYSTPRRARSSRPEPLRDGAEALLARSCRADKLWRSP